MKRRDIFLVLAAVLILTACSQGGESPAAQADGETVVLTIKGMNCSAWPDAIRAALEGVAGVQVLEMNYKQQTAKVIYDPGKTGPEMLVEAVAFNGLFEASVLP